MPFHIDKTGYGNAAAWMVVDDINTIRVHNPPHHASGS